MSLRAQIRDLAGFLRRTERSVQQYTRDLVDHVVLLDGTMSSLAEGEEANAGLIYKHLEEVARSGRVSLCHAAGTQWSDWSKTLDVIEGRGINRRIRRAYGWLASRYRPGDRIFLIGYSRGAFAVRSLAGVIDGDGAPGSASLSSLPDRSWQGSWRGVFRKRIAGVACRSR